MFQDLTSLGIRSCYTSSKPSTQRGYTLYYCFLISTEHKNSSTIHLFTEYTFHFNILEKDFFSCKAVINSSHTLLLSVFLYYHYIHHKFQLHA